MIAKYTVTFSTEIKKHLEQNPELQLSKGFHEAIRLPALVLSMMLVGSPEYAGIPSGHPLTKFFLEGHTGCDFLRYAFERATRMTVFVSFFPVSLSGDFFRVMVTFLSGNNPAGDGATHHGLTVIYDREEKIYHGKFEFWREQKKLFSIEQGRKCFNYGLAQSAVHCGSENFFWGSFFIHSKML